MNNPFAVKAKTIFQKWQEYRNKLAVKKEKIKEMADRVKKEKPDKGSAIQVMPVKNIVRVLRIKKDTGEIISKHTYKNITCINGRSEIAQRLIDSANTEYLGVIRVGAIGTGETTPTETDTVLEAETNRVAIDLSECTNTNNTTTIYFEFTGAFSGTYKEAGVFTGATAIAGSANSGKLLLRTAIDEYKATDEFLAILWEIQINNG